MIITVGNIKGGVGKSTLACNMAVQLSQTGASVALIDGDKQGSSAEFTEQRAAAFENGAGYMCARAVGAEVRQQVKSLSEHYAHIIVDAGGQDNPALRAALTVTDAVLVPVPPKSFETWSLDVMAELVAEVRETVNPDLKAYAVVNMGFPAGQDNDFVQALIREDYPAFDLLKTVVVSRKAFSDGAGMGLSVTETKAKDVKAISEFMAVMEDMGLSDNNITSIAG